MVSFLERLGFTPVEATRSIAILAGGETVAEEAQALVRLIQRRYARIPTLLLTDVEGPVSGFARYPHLYRLPRAERRFLRRSRVKMLVLAGDFASLPASLIERAYRRGCDILAVVRGDAATGEAERAALDAMSWRRRVSRVVLTGGLPARDEGDIAVADVRRLTEGEGEALIDQLETHLVSSKRKKLRPDGRAARRLRRIARARRSVLLGPVMRGKFKEIASVDELRAALGAPKTILCLGNGPTSEAPELDRIRYDRLFRVNSSWKARRRFVKADLVFTSLSASIRAVRPTVGFVMKNPEDKTAMLAAFAFVPRLIRYAVAARLGVYDQDYFGHYSPTNGAVMLAVAVALKPEHLVIAGIDLFAHPEGAYPQDSSTVNDYSVGHDRQRETNFLMDLLAGFGGKLTILSPALAQAVEKAGSLKHTG